MTFVYGDCGSVLGLITRRVVFVPAGAHERSIVKVYFDGFEEKCSVVSDCCLKCVAQ